MIEQFLSKAFAAIVMITVAIVVFLDLAAFCVLVVTVVEKILNYKDSIKKDRIERACQMKAMRRFYSLNDDGEGPEDDTK